MSKKVSAKEKALLKKNYQMEIKNSEDNISRLQEQVKFHNDVAEGLEKTIAAQQESLNQWKSKLKTVK